MKNWLIYILCLTIGFCCMPTVTVRMAEDGIPIITLRSEEQISEISVEDFAVRILIAEKPTHPEAMRALAISARSIGAYLSIFGCKHEEFDLCDSGDCCFTLGNTDDCPDYLLEKYKKAVNETYGMALTANEIPAMALFCLCSGSGTGNSDEFLYLKSVSEPSPCLQHISKSQLPYSVLKEICEDKNMIMTNSVLVYESNRKCDFAIIGGKYISGFQLKKLLNAESNEIEISFSEDYIYLNSAGNGHGYGMSLCGAENMAKNGKSYQEILKFYYPELLLNKIYHN